MVKCAGTNFQKAGSDEDKDLVDEGWVSEGESEGEEDSLIPAGGLLEDMQAGDDGEVAGMVGRNVEIVTRSGRRAGRVIYSGDHAHGHEWNPGHGWSLCTLR